jgi:uncharacterized protein (DUF433 family)
MSDMANIESPATTDARAYVGKGIYQFPFAAQLAKSSQQELRRWLLGLTIKRGRTYSEYEPLWRPTMPWFDGRPVLSFMDLMEVRFVKYFRDSGVSLQSIRKILDTAKAEIGSLHPFATKRFQTDGREFFMRVAKSSREEIFVRLKKNQLGFYDFFKPSLYEGIEFSVHGTAVAWWPLGEGRDVVLDPARQLGLPILSSSAVPTSVIAQAFALNNNVEGTADEFGISPSSVRAALDFENIYALPRRPLH